MRGRIQPRRDGAGWRSFGPHIEPLNATRQPEPPRNRPLKCRTRNVRRDHFVTVGSEGGGHRSGTTARLPDGATKLEPLEQRLGDPIRHSVEVTASPVESGYMDAAIICGRRRRRTIRLCCLRPDDRQGVLMWPNCDQCSGRSAARCYTVSLSSLATRKATFLLALEGPCPQSPTSEVRARSRRGLRRQQARR